MAKLVTAKRHEVETERAREYVRTHILFPSGLLGMLFMVSGTASLVYQLGVSTYTWHTFVESMGLLWIGGILGWGQTRYHQFLLREHPGYFAGRLRLFSRTQAKAGKKEAQVPAPRHTGHAWVPLWYALGAGLLLSGSTASVTFGHVYFMAAFMIPWAGFFWAKLFFWRGVLEESKK
jgi:hypothetical protein